MGDAGRCGSIAGHIGAGCASLLEAGDGGDSGGFATTESRLENSQHACGVWAGTCGACLCACHLGLRYRLCRLCSRCPLLPHGGPAPALTKSADGGVRVVAHEWTVLSTCCGSRMCAYGLCHVAGGGCALRACGCFDRAGQHLHRHQRLSALGICLLRLVTFESPRCCMGYTVSLAFAGNQGANGLQETKSAVFTAEFRCVCARVRVCACACVLLFNSGQITDVS